MDSRNVAARHELRLSNAGQRDLLRAFAAQGATLRTPARGVSMQPLICDRDILTIVPLANHAPRAGDVIAFTLPGSGKLTIHRVVARTEGGWILRGDSSAQDDGVIPRSEMIGIVTRVERQGRAVRLCLGPAAGCIAALRRQAGIRFLRRLAALPWHAGRKIARRFVQACF